MRSTEFHQRRKELAKLIGKGGIAILPAAVEKNRNGDVQYHYRPDSDFYYVTGFHEPEAVAVLVPGRPQAEYILFVRERDPTRETWDGKRSGPDGVTRDFGADDAFPFGDIDDILPGLMENCPRVYYTMGLNQDFDQRVIGWVNGLKAQARTGVHPPLEFVALDHLLHDMRLYKSKPELDVMRRSAQIAVAAHKRAMRFVEPGRHEYEVMAELTHEFRMNNADTSYHPIVGSGPNSCILHYHENSEEMRDGDLLLIDAGCEYGMYASDITTSFPVNGRYTPEQKAVYEVVLQAQIAAFDAIKPGNHWDDPHEAAVKSITSGLVKIGLLKGKVPQLIKEGAYRKFFMHRTGHWLGIDVHDCGDYKVGNQWRVLEQGMVMTVEPGIYIPAGTKGVAKRWWNIGVRIEDDVAVTKNGCEILTAGLPREPEDVERFMR